MSVEELNEMLARETATVRDLREQLRTKHRTTISYDLGTWLMWIAHIFWTVVATVRIYEWIGFYGAAGFVTIVATATAWMLRKP